jgi:hypothetical protein
VRAIFLLLLLLMSPPLGGASYVPVTLTLLPPSVPFGFRPMTPAWKGMSASIEEDVLTLSFGKERLTYGILEHTERTVDGVTYVYLRVKSGGGVLLRRR